MEIVKDIIENLFLPLVHRNCITVIGSEAILKPSKDNNDTGDSMVLLLKSWAERQQFTNSNISACKTENDFWEMFHNRELPTEYRNLRAEVSNSTIIQRVQSDFNDRKVSEDIWADGLLTLLRWNRVVFTTSTDCCIEYAMRQAYIYENKDVEVFDMVDVHSPNGRKELANQLEEINKNPYNAPPILVYLLGRIEKKSGLYSEASYVEAIYTASIMMEEQSVINNFIRDGNKSILMVGTQMDDWRFRFLWHLLTYKISNLPQFRASIVFSRPGYIKADFDNFFSDQTHDFLRQLGNALDTDQAYDVALRDFNGNKKIFVSYKHLDYDVAKGVVNLLKGQSYRVWFDETSLLPGDKYLKVISQALEKTDYVVIILTSNVAKDLNELNSNINWQGNIDEQMINLYKEKKTCFYLIHEWRYALKQNKKIIPIHTDSYDPQGNAQEIFDKIWGADDTGDKMSVDAYIRDQANDLVEKIKTIVNGNER